MYPRPSVTLLPLLGLLGSKRMPLRCLLFSSCEQVVQPIRQVLDDLGIQGEYCHSAVDAVERVTTQQFQIVITDWENQPEAAFLLKTARDLKPAQRPLTLAVVNHDALLPQALQAGANSVLVKPIRAEQVRDTMSTACELLRAKQQSAPLPPPARDKPEALASAAAASAAPISVTQPPEKTFRAGEFLQSPVSAPGAEFDTEGALDLQKSLDESAIAEVDALTDLAPTAAAVQDAPPVPEEKIEPKAPLTGWASLQARLTKSAPPPEPPLEAELLSYSNTPSTGAAASEEVSEAQPEWHPSPPDPDASTQEAEDAALPAPQASSDISRKLNKVFLPALAATLAIMFAVPRTRQILRALPRNAARAGANWLNPPPAALPQAPPQHDDFAQAGDEYKLPVPENIPDATTDPSQIRVLPVTDPTAKPEKADANGSQTTIPPTENNPDLSAAPPAPAGGAQFGGPQVAGPKDDRPQEDSSHDVLSQAAADPNTPPQSAAAVPMPHDAVSSMQTSPSAKTPGPQLHSPVPLSNSPAPRPVSASTPAGIPSSLKSQLASSAPEASGTRPAETAMSSIEPVNLPESAVRELLSQPVEPEYPAAKANGQSGTVVLQVLIARDGTIQDAKFLQGSLLFARPAIDAVKQWRFKPYSMNGRPVSVQSIITLNFKPPA